MTNNPEAQRYRRLNLYHSCMDMVVAEINERCSEDRHSRFANGRVREGLCFSHLLGMDGLEIAATSMCDTDQCLVCKCPKDELDRSHRTDFLYPLLYWKFFFLGGGASKLRWKQLKQKLLNPDGSIKNRCKGRACNDILHIYLT